MNKFLSVGLLLNRASVSIGKRLNSTLLEQGIDLPQSQFIVLRCLHYHNEISQIEIAKMLFKDAAAIKRTVDNLVEKGLVTREQERLQKNCICLSDKGREILPKALAVAESVTEEALESIDDKQYEQLRKMLDTIYNNSEKK